MSKIAELKHVVRRIPDGGMVLILNTGAEISPEGVAMLQALHSRSLGGIISHLVKLIEKGPEAFMKMFFVQYGHKSIGDCGSITIFVEGVSMLVAKAIQDWRLYSGQEASTRYIDFSSQTFIDPIGSQESSMILESLRRIHLKGLDVMQKALVERYPINVGEKEEVYEKAIKARAFDVMRSLLPCGACTNLAWHSNIRQVGDKLAWMRHHVLPEVREVAMAIEDACIEAYPSSFSKKRYPATEEYNAMVMRDHYFLSSESDADILKRFTNRVVLSKSSIDIKLLAQSRKVLEQRPKKAELPNYLEECGTMQFEFLLDFGSFRDVQRHRAVVQRMPLVTMEYGFENWYMEQFPKTFREGVDGLLTYQRSQFRFFGNSPLAQYYIPMGYNIPNRITGGLPSLVYLCELRATSMVHPTLSCKAAEMGKILLQKLGRHGLVLHLDEDPGRFDVRRGAQDIIEKK